MRKVWAIVKDKLLLPILTVYQREKSRLLEKSLFKWTVVANFYVIYSFFRKKLLSDEIGLIPRPLTYLLFPLDQQLALKIPSQFIFNPEAWGFSWSLAGPLLPQPKQKSTLLWSPFLLAAEGTLEIIVCPQSWISLSGNMYTQSTQARTLFWCWQSKHSHCHLPAPSPWSLEKVPRPALISGVPD